MSENAIDARAATDKPEPQITDRQITGPAMEEASVLNPPRGPSALQSTLLIARVTFREAARRRILWIAMLAGIGFLAFFWTALHFVVKHSSPHAPVINVREGIVMMTMMVLYAGSMFTSLMAVLTPCDTLSGEIASGTIHAVATKPVQRWCIVLGKWVGFAEHADALCIADRGRHHSDQLDPERLSSPARLGCSLPDLATGHRAARDYHGGEHQLFISHQRRHFARTLWPGFCRGMDRAVWIVAACESLRRVGNSFQPHHAQRRPLAPRCLQVPAAIARSRRPHSLQRRAGAESCDGCLCCSLCCVRRPACSVSLLTPRSVGAASASPRHHIKSFS